jgi:hypothetical protein
MKNFINFMSALWPLNRKQSFYFGLGLAAVGFVLGLI